MSRKVTSILTDPRYQDLIETYSDNWDLACRTLFGFDPTHQQCDIMDAVNQIGSKVSIRSGHGTGKSWNTAAIIIIYMILYPKARVVVIANKIKQVMDAIWKYMKIHFAELKKRFPWVAKYFVLTETSFYERTQKGVWYVSAKGFKINNEESLAGEHADHMLTIVDEASAVNDKAFGVLTGAQTSGDNRFMLLSQPTRMSGFFYRTHHELNQPDDDGKVEWISLKLSSLDTELVTEEFIITALKTYGGFDSAEFQIKVLGEFPTKMGDFLLGRYEVESAVKRALTLADDWGWIATVDVGFGRDRSVINIARVSGEIGAERLVESFMRYEFPADLTPRQLRGKIKAYCLTGSFPNITIAIDAHGGGQQVVDELKAEVGDKVNIKALKWGDKPFSKKDKERFFNLRAKAHVLTRDAIQQGRISLDEDNKTVEQFAKLPCHINDHGQWLMMKKEVMKTKHNIPSPDISDTYCFFQLVNYVPANQANDDDWDEDWDDMEDLGDYQDAA